MGLFARAKWRVDGAHVGTSYQNLRNLFCLYGNDLYYRMALSKEERNTCGAVAPDNKDLLHYCLSPDTLIQTSLGKTPVSELKPGVTLPSFNHKTGKVEQDVVYAVTRSTNVRRMVRVKSAGTCIVVTHDHPVWSVTQNAYVEAGKIKPGEKILLL